MAEYTKPLPAISTLNQPYWDGLKQREMVLPKCKPCNKVWYPPTRFCPTCWSPDFSWQQLSGRGKVNSWVVFHQAYFSALKDDVPYNVAEVALEEGPRLLTNLVEVSNEEIRIGMAVEVVYEDVTAEVTLAKFKPVRQG